MARKPKQTTQERIDDKRKQIEEQEGILESLKNELKELINIKIQEDKDELYNLLITKNLTVEQAKEILAS